jgi:ribonuclease HI
VSWTVWCDGSGTTGGPAGIAFVAKTVDGHTVEGSLPLENATNQQAELLAAAYALTLLPQDSDVTIVSDSRYVVDGSQKVRRWAARDWIKDDGKIAANVPHWRRLLAALAGHRSVRFEWVRGHADCVENQRADELAGAARRSALDRAASLL